MLSQERPGNKWDVVGISELRGKGDRFKVLNNGHVICYRGHPVRGYLEVAFLIRKETEGNVKGAYSISERVAIKLNRRHKLRVVQLYAP